MGHTVFLHVPVCIYIVVAIQGALGLSKLVCCGVMFPSIYVCLLQ